MGLSTNVYTSDLTVDDAPKGALVESMRLREQRIAANVDGLVGRPRPEAISSRAMDKVAGVFVGPDGKPDVARLAIVGGAVLGLAALVVVGIARQR